MNTHKQAGQVDDLVEKYHQQSITKEEIIETLKNRKLTERDIFKGGMLGYIPWVLLCFLPCIAATTQWDIFNWFTQLPRIYFPNWAIYLALAMFLLAIPITVAGITRNVKHGGLQSENETILLMQEGIYGIIRHPSMLAWSIFFVTIPIFLSPYIPFTILSAIGIIFIIAFNYYALCTEERELDIKKWGDQYREYMQARTSLEFYIGFVEIFSKKIQPKKEVINHEETSTNFSHYFS